MQLKKHELIELFSSSIENAKYLFDTALEIALHTKNKKFTSLGIAELALEELGKSYSCLAMYSRAEITEDWSLFWKEWRQHDLKASRAFLYEFFSVERFEIDFAEIKLKFPTERQYFSREKELAFYVDIDKGNRQIHKPVLEITDEECLRRITSLVGLFNVVFNIKDWLSENNSDDFINALSDYAHIVLTTNIYQQDAVEVLSKMKNEKEDYNKGIQKIIDFFTEKKVIE